MIIIDLKHQLIYSIKLYQLNLIAYKRFIVKIKIKINIYSVIHVINIKKIFFFMDITKIKHKI